MLGAWNCWDEESDKQPMQFCLINSHNNQHTTIKQQSNNNQTTIKQQSNNNQTTINQQSINKQTTIKQQSNNNQTTIKQQPNNKQGNPDMTFLFCFVLFCFKATLDHG